MSRASTTSAAFADVTAELCRDLGVGRLAAVVGISAGGRTALAMAARHPHLVERLILQSAVGFLPWPDRRTRLGGRLVFNAGIEAATWAAVHLLMRIAPQAGLRLLLRDLSTLPIRHVVAGLSEHDRAELLALFGLMRSGSGFLNDMLVVPDCAAQVGQPALIIASRTDRSVPFAHAESLATALPWAELVASQADGHMIWFGSDYPAIAGKIKDSSPRVEHSPDPSGPRRHTSPWQAGARASADDRSLPRECAAAGEDQPPSAAARQSVLSTRRGDHCAPNE